MCEATADSCERRGVAVSTCVRTCRCARMGSHAAHLAAEVASLLDVEVEELHLELDPARKGRQEAHKQHQPASPAQESAHSLRRFSFCVLAFLSCVSDRFQNSPYLRVSCRRANGLASTGGAREEGSWHAPCEELQNPCGSPRAQRPAPPSVIPAWIRCPPAGAMPVRWHAMRGCDGHLCCAPDPCCCTCCSSAPTAWHAAWHDSTCLKGGQEESQRAADPI